MPLNQYITDLSVATTISTADLLVLELDPSGAGGTRSITVANFLGTIPTGSLKLLDTDESNALGLKWNEDAASNYTFNILVGGGSRSLTLNENFTVGDGANVTITAEDAASSLTLDNCSLEAEDEVGSGNTIKFVIATDDASRTVTLSENLTIGDGANVTITAEDAAGTITLDNCGLEVEDTANAGNIVKLVNANDDTDKTVTLNENLTVGAGNDGTLTYSAASKTLTVENNAIVSQDYSSDATPTFGGANVNGRLYINANNSAALWVEQDGVKDNVFVIDTVNGRVGVGTSPASLFHIKGAAVKFTIDDTSATGNPFFEFSQAGTRRSYHGHVDAGDVLRMASEYGSAEILTGTGGSEQIRIAVSATGLTSIGVGANTTTAQLHVKQASASGAVPVLKLEQSDTDDTFIDFVGTSAASAANSISSWTAGNTIQGFARIEINGSTFWLPYYDAPTS